MPDKFSDTASRTPVLDQPPRRRRGSRDPLETPISLDPLDVHCQYCPGQQFRRSRLRAKDLRDIALMRYPVRCLRCSQRQFVSFTVAGLAISSTVKHSRPKKAGENWPEGRWMHSEASRQRAGAKEKSGAGTEGDGVSEPASGDLKQQGSGVVEKPDRPPAAPPAGAMHPDPDSPARRKGDPDGNEVW